MGSLTTTSSELPTLLARKEKPLSYQVT